MDESRLYNSAIKNGTVVESAEPTERFRLGRSIGQRWNIVTEPPPPELYKCDVVYCEPPFPAGIKVFDERAGESTPSYAAFAIRFAAAWSTITAPKYAITNSRLLSNLPEPDGIVKTKLNGHAEKVAWWNGPEPPPGLSNLALCEWLGHRFSRMADITCGYGRPLIHFCKSRQGNSFLGTDYDPHCITVLKRLALKEIYRGS